MKTDRDTLIQLLLCCSFPLLFCQCGETRDPEDKAVEVARAARFPRVDAADSKIPAEVFAAIQRETWARVLETVSEEEPVWKAVSVEGSPGGALAELVVMGEPTWVVFKLSADGTSVTPVEIGEGERVLTEDPNEIALGFVGLYTMKTGALDSKPLIAATNTKATMTKNMLILKQIGLGSRMVALETDGSFPDDIATIVEAGVLEDNRRRVVNPETGETEEPILFAGLTDVSPPKMMMMACPFTNPDGTRTVAFVDGSILHIPEGDYQERAAAQK